MPSPGAARSPQCPRRSPPGQGTEAAASVMEPVIEPAFDELRWNGKCCLCRGTRRVKNSPKKQRLAFIRPGHGSNKQNTAFGASLRRALPAAPATRVPRVPSQPVPSAGLGSARPGLLLLLLRGHFLSTPCSWPGTDPSASHGDTCCWNKLLFLWTTLVVFYTYCRKMNSHFYAKRFYCGIRKC